MTSCGAASFATQYRREQSCDLESHKVLPCEMLQICCLTCSVAVVKVVQSESEHTNKFSRMRLEMVLVLEHTHQFKEKEAAFVIY